ncbi:ThrRS/AlaRS common domain-containing protein [Suillus paluster]|uniref:ThrRS/AlaRS common domain-containing protein n=1 Tax=Suillus paluster TaxID=48578 RepID=UPI001B870BF3|nr:ThrRS/AlaRS common domain-containing protein [Suillus paluster]KAG1753985.1 ThrRS/AlaRS common domain-containing protein [Suillus paluster]
MAAAVVALYPTVTPPSYHRIVSPTLKIPTETQRPIPVGLLACQRDPLLRELETTIISCTISQPASSPSIKKGKKASAPAPVDQPTLEVILHDTVIFPEGGGQPSDTGIIKTADGRTWTVIQAKRHGGHGVHYVRAEQAENGLSCLTPGTKVTVALGELDFDRRYDHMSMHTSQHLLSAVLENRLDIHTLSWSLTAAPAPCYVELGRSMTVEEILSIQNEANKLVFEGRKVHVEVQEMDDKPQPAVPVLESGRAVGKGVPTDYTGGIMRTVIIDGVDRNPRFISILQMLRHTPPTLHNLQLFIIPQTETLSRSSTTSARLYFLAGPRLITYLTSTHSQLAAAATTLSCGAPQVPDRIGQVVDDRKRAEKRVDDLEFELAKHVAGDVLQEMKSSEAALFVKHVHRTDDSINPLGLLSAMTTAFANTAPAERPFVLIFSSSPSSQTGTSASVLLVFGSDEKYVKAAGDLLKGKLNVKGGGKGTRWSGKFTGVWRESREDAAVSEVLQAVST